MERYKYKRGLLGRVEAVGVLNREICVLTDRNDTKPVIQAGVTKRTDTVLNRPSPQTTKECQPGEVATTRPSRPCPAGHPLPYGLHHWQDPYGQWHCTECHPPAAPAMVRDEVVVDAHGVATTDDFTVSAGGKVLNIAAVQLPDGKYLFNPDTTQAKRREIVEHHAAFERWDEVRRHAECREFN